MLPTTGDPELLNHFTVAIYPFLHDLNTRNRSARLDALGERWAPWWTRMTGDERADALESTAFFLPYVRSLLYPEVTALRDEPAGPRYAHWAERLNDWSSGGLARFARQLPASVVMRLTMREAHLRPLTEFRVAPRPGKEASAVDLRGRLDWVDVQLFPAGVGFLLLKYRVVTPRPTLSHLIEMNHSVRMVHPPSLGWSMRELLFDTGASATVPDLMNFLIQGLARSTGRWIAGRFQPLGTPVNGTPYTDTEPGLAYGERCQVLSYACIQLTDGDRAALPAGEFPCSEDRLLFEYAASIGLGQSVQNPMWVPSPEQVERLRRENRLSLWRCWKALALKESCVFLGTEGIPFNRRSLPGVIESDYLPLYLYALHQKVQLMTFANDLMHEVAQVEGHLRGARELLRRFVAFRNRFWFNEVTRKPQGGDLYRLMQQSLDVPGLYQMALASVKEAKEYYEDRWDRQVRFGLTLLGLGGPLAAFYGAARTVMEGLPLLAVGVALAGVTAAALWLLRRQKGTKKAHRPRRHVRRGSPEMLPYRRDPMPPRSRAA